MRFIKDMNLYDIVKIKENGVPVDYTIVFKITPDNPFNGYTSGVALVRIDYIVRIDRIVSPAKVRPLIVIKNETVVNDAGILCGSDDEANTNEADYVNSNLRKWCKTSYSNLIQEDILNQIMNLNDSAFICHNGSKCKFFLLSTMELNAPGNMSPNGSMEFPIFLSIPR